jgi:hypothetical protein
MNPHPQLSMVDTYGLARPMDGSVRENAESVRVLAAVFLGTLWTVDKMVFFFMDVGSALVFAGGKCTPPSVLFTLHSLVAYKKLSSPVELPGSLFSRRRMLHASRSSNVSVGVLGAFIHIGLARLLDPPWHARASEALRSAS